MRYRAANGLSFSSALVLALATALSEACGGGTPTAPEAVSPGPQASAPTACTVSIPDDQLTRTVAHGAGTFTVSVSAAASCAWTSTTTDDFLTITAGATGSGSGTVAVSIAANPGSERKGTLRIAAVTVSVTQHAAPPPNREAPSPDPTPPAPVPPQPPAPVPPAPPAPPAPAPPTPDPGNCTFSVTPLNAHVPAAGGTVTVTVKVTRGANCAWTALPHDPFMVMEGGVDRTGNGIITLIVAPNTGPARAASATVAGQTVRVTQDAVAPTTCVFAVSPTRVSLPVSGGTVTFNVKVTQGTSCAWTTTIAGSGMTITSGASGTGDGTVVVSVAANPGSERTNGIIIAGQLVTITQPEATGACAFAAEPRSFNISSAAQTVTFDVTITTGTPAHCTWSVGWADPSLLRLVSMTPSGNTTRVVVAVSENTGRVDRSLSIEAARVVVVVRQAGSIPPGPCQYAVSTTSINAPAGASTTRMSVSLVQGSVFACTWSIVPNAAFISVAGYTPSPETGGANFGLVVAANTGPARVGTVSVAGHTVTVSQAGGAPAAERAQQQWDPFGARFSPFSRLPLCSRWCSTCQDRCEATVPPLLLIHGKRLAGDRNSS